MTFSAASLAAQAGRCGGGALDRPRRDPAAVDPQVQLGRGGDHPDRRRVSPARDVHHARVRGGVAGRQTRREGPGIGLRAVGPGWQRRAQHTAEVGLVDVALADRRADRLDTGAVDLAAHRGGPRRGRRTPPRTPGTVPRAVPAPGVRLHLREPPRPDPALEVRDHRPEALDQPDGIHRAVQVVHHAACATPTEECPAGRRRAGRAAVRLTGHRHTVARPLVGLPARASTTVPDAHDASADVLRGRGSVGRASPCQGEGRGFESRRPLGGDIHLVDSSLDGGVAERRGSGLQSRIHGFESRLHLAAAVPCKT